MATSCVDEILPGEDLGVVDGSLRTLAVEVGFEVEDETELASSRANRDEAITGNSIQNIKSLNLLIYDEAGALLDNLKIMNKGVTQNVTGNVATVTGVKYNLDDNRLPDEKNEEFQDKSSGKVNFTIEIRSANYYIYAVANADDLPAEQLENRHNMKRINRKWVIGDIAQNSEMFGIFSETPDRNATDDSPVSITNKMVKLHCWLRRLASKVTVAFDGTELYDNVEVYIDTIAIFDIPKLCSLGNPNMPGRDYSQSTDPYARLSPSVRYTTESGLIYHGAYDVVQDLSQASKAMLLPESYEHVCNAAHPYLGKGKDGADPETITNRHAHKAKSLFFYENIQGIGNCKKQDADGDNKIDHENPKPGDVTSGWKDGKAYGTYVQVHGYYRCTSNDGSMSFGPIRYRFMLGKNTIDDFNAERNTHYQLTLMLKGYGNDADWHIEYEHKFGITVASPQFISYLYNKKMMATVKVSGDIEKLNGKYLKAEIVDDKYPWQPWGDGSTLFPKAPSGNTDASPGIYWNGTPNVTGKIVGFLSLRQTNVSKIEAPGYEGAPSTVYDNIDNKTLLTNYYYGNASQFPNVRNRGERFYEIAEQKDGYETNNNGDDGKYFVTNTSVVGDRVVERIFNIPLYTRAKELVTRTGYTANNPYYRYPRKQTIKFTVVDAAKKDIKDFEPIYLEVIQVPRIVNPKGVWRSSGTDPFHVTLMEMAHDSDDKFEEFNSNGKWSAEVVTQEGATPIITLSTTTKGSGVGNRPQNHVSRIEGESEHPIDFTINFTGAQGFAAVRVRYHNYSCEHDIFCHNGYFTSVDVAGNGTEWSSCNVDYFKDGIAYPTKSPLQEGAMFRRGSEIGIRSTNSKNFGVGVSIANKTLDVYLANGDKDSKKWEDIKYSKSFGNTHKWDIKNANQHIATGADFYEFVSKTANESTFAIKKAYGVLYGDGASEVADNTAEAFGYDSETGAASSKGMRGVFVYNVNTLNQLFFPIGISGHGRRKHSTGASWSGTEPSHGTMRYANRAAIMSAAGAMPLLYDLKRHNGAIYWIYQYNKTFTQLIAPNGTKYDDASQSSAFDINYTTFGFEGFTNNAVPSESEADACFIRLVNGAAPQ